MKGLVFDTENQMQFKDFGEPLLDNLQKEVGGCFLLCAVESILCAVVQTVELLVADDLQTLIPDGVPAVFLIGLDVVLDPANNQLHTLGAKVVVECGEQHPDDLGAVCEVDVSDLALASAHRSGVDVVALRHVAVGCCGELSVDVNELHAENLRFTLDKSSIKK